MKRLFRWLKNRRRQKLHALIEHIRERAETLAMMTEQSLSMRRSKAIRMMVHIDREASSLACYLEQLEQSLA